MTNQGIQGQRSPPRDSFTLPLSSPPSRNKLYDKVHKSNARKHNTKLMWPIHQINWQQLHYVYNMYYLHHRITKKVYKYCVRNKLVNTALIAKWKKTGYKQLCLTYVINTNNYMFGMTLICHVPLKER